MLVSDEGGPCQGNFPEIELKLRVAKSEKNYKLGVMNQILKYMQCGEKTSAKCSLLTIRFS